MQSSKLFFAGLFGVAVWIIAGVMVVDRISPEHPTLLGFAFGLLAMLTVLIPSRPQPNVTICLMICGTACVLASISLQFYVASASLAMNLQNSQQVIEALRDASMTNKPAANFSLNSQLPTSINTISYLALMFGSWLGAVGVRGSVADSLTALGTSSRRELLDVNPILAGA